MAGVARFFKNLAKPGGVKSFIKKGMVTSQYEPYWEPVAKTQGQEHIYRYPSPGTNVDPVIPSMEHKHKFDIAYYKRDDISKVRNIVEEKPELIRHTPQETTDARRKELDIMPWHVDKPWWWFEQDEIMAKWEAVGQWPVMGKQYWDMDVFYVTDELENYKSETGVHT